MITFDLTVIPSVQGNPLILDVEGDALKDTLTFPALPGPGYLIHLYGDFYKVTNVIFDPDQERIIVEVMVDPDEFARLKGEWSRGEEP